MALPCIPHRAVIIELGVAEGVFSEQLLQHDKEPTVWSIDRWAGDRAHDHNEYMRARARLDPYFPRSIVVTKTFHEALSGFSDEFADMIYVDGYAHTGQENGSTLHEWWPKVKRGGILAGHDYDLRWPETVKAVDHFASAYGLTINILKERVTQYNSWWVVKP